MTISANAVTETFMYCFFTEEELKGGAPTADQYTVGDGVMNSVAFHNGRLAESRDKVKEMLTHFEDAFYTEGGGGYSFLNMVTTKDGTLWTGMQRTVDQLVILGNALDYVTLTPREMNAVLPGGVPYVIIDSKVHEA